MNKPRLEVVKKVFKKRIDNPWKDDFLNKGGWSEVVKVDNKYIARGCIRFAGVTKWWVVALRTPVDLYGTYKDYRWYLDLWHDSNEPRLALFNKENEKLYENYFDNAKHLMTMIISGMLDTYLKECLDDVIRGYEVQKEINEKGIKGI